jgi:hypothetical protein
MSLHFIDDAAGKVLEVRFSGKLVREDCEQFEVEIERRVLQDGTQQLLFDMTDFLELDPGCRLSENLFSVKHVGEIKRLAMIGESQWQPVMAAFSKPFTRATLRYFVGSESDKARIWLGRG